MSVSVVSIQPKYVYGLRKDIKGNIHFMENQEVIYPVAGVIAIHDFKQSKQTFLRLTENHVPTVIAISPNRKLLAIAEWNDVHQTCGISTYDLSLLKKKKTFKLPKDVPNQDVEFLRFTEDSRGLAVLSKEPDAFLTIFYFDKSETVIVGRVSNGNQKGLTADVIACNLNDTGLVAVGGKYVFKLMSRQDKSFGTIGTMTGEHKIVTSLVWLTAEILVAGTSANQLLFYEGGDPKQNFLADSAQLIDLEKAKESDGDQSHLSLNSVATSSSETEVHCLTNFDIGFCYSQHNRLFVYEKEKSYVRFTRRSIIEIPVDLYAKESYKIVNVSVNAQMDTVIVTALHNQIYISKLFEPETTTLQSLNFSMLGEPLHIDGIIGMTTCSWKPIIMTAAKDLTVRIWNYETASVELVKKYQICISVLALHPTGLFAAIGFTDQLHLKEILLDTLKTVKTFDFPHSNVVVFSHQGHLLACAYGNLISIVSVFSFNIVQSFKNHSGNVLSMAWSNDDRYLVSSGDDGAIYEWCVLTGERVGESVEKGIHYRSLALTNDRSIYVCTNTGVFREIQKSDIVREINPNAGIPLTKLTLSRSDLMLFLGTESGNLYNIQLPLLEAGGGTCTNYRFFSRSVSCMSITFDDRFLVVGSEDGTLVVWVIVNSEGKTAAVDSEHGKCADVIVARQDLMEQIKKMENLETRLSQQSREYSFEIEYARKMHTLEIEKISTEFQKIIDKLKEERAALELKHQEESNIIQATIEDIKDQHSRHFLELEAKYNEKIITEFDKTSALKTKIDNLKEEYEKLLRKSSGCLEETIQTLERNFDDQLMDRQGQIKELLEEIQTKKHEFFQYCSQLNLNNERTMAQLKLKYQTQLNESNDNVLKWRTEAGVLSKRIDNISNKCEMLTSEQAIFLEEHGNYKKYINQLEQNSCELQRDLEIKTNLVEEKDKCLLIAMEKNQSLEKMKMFLNRRIEELESQIKPKDQELKEMAMRLLEMEEMRRNDFRNAEKLNIEISGLKDVCTAFRNNLKSEEDKRFCAETLIERMRSDIFSTVQDIQNIPKLKSSVMQLYQKYSKAASNVALHNDKNSSSANKQEERPTPNKKNVNKSSTKQQHKRGQSEQKLLRDNLRLLAEIDKLKAENKGLGQRLARFETMNCISHKISTSNLTKTKLESFNMAFTEMDVRHKRLGCEDLRKSFGSL